MLLRCVVFSLAGFVSGSVMYSYYIPRLFLKVDVRGAGADHNPGGANAVRTAGPVVGGVCIVCDLLKAFAPVFIAVSLYGVGGAALIPVLLAPVLGHVFSPLLGFRGGKGVAATFGALLGLLPSSRSVFILAVVLAFFTFVTVVRPDSSRLMAGSAVSFVAVLFLEPSPAVKIAFCAMMCLLFFQHRNRPDGKKSSISLFRLRYGVDFSNGRLRLHRIG